MEDKHEIPPHGKTIPALPAEGPSSSLPQPARAGWWAWPLILFSLLPFDLLLSPFFVKEERKKESKASTALGDDSADLALLKVQAQVWIASATLDPAAAAAARDELGSLIKGDRGVAAVALLESFIQSDSQGAADLLEEFSGEAPEGLAELTRTAVREGVGEGDRESLRSHLGWFADLARGPGLSPPTGEASIRKQAFIVFGVMGVLTVLAGGAFLTGAVLLVLHLRRIRTGKVVNAFVPSGVRGGVLLESFALYLGILSASALAAAFLGSAVGVVGYGLAVVLPLGWPWLRGISWREFRLAVGLHRGKGFWREVGAGCVGYLGVLAVASIGIALMLAISFIVEVFNAGPDGAGGSGARASSGPEVHPVVGWIYEGNLWVRLACFALAAGFAPVFEELFFRGALQGYFRGRFRFLVSALLTGLLFAALHPQGLIAIPALAGIGIGFSLLREWRDSLIAPMTAHAINNGCLVITLWWLL